MSKRQKFVITSSLLSLGFLALQFIDDKYRFLGISSLGLSTFLLFYWSLREGLGWNMTLMSLILPFYFTMGVGLFWFLLPSNLFTRIPIAIFYGFGIYALCLTSNIYTVASIRTIALLRAARGVGFVITLVTFFLLFDAILSIHPNILMNTSSIILFSFPLLLQGFWTITLGKKISKELLSLSLISSLILGEIATNLYFWPVTVIVGSIFLTVALYILLGLGQAKLEGRLFRQTVREYLLVGALVFLGMFLSTRWGG